MSESFWEPIATNRIGLYKLMKLNQNDDIWKIEQSVKFRIQTTWKLAKNCRHLLFSGQVVLNRWSSRFPAKNLQEVGYSTRYWRVNDCATYSQNKSHESFLRTEAHHYPVGTIF